MEHARSGPDRSGWYRSRSRSETPASGRRTQAMRCQCISPRHGFCRAGRRRRRSGCNSRRSFAVRRSARSGRRCFRRQRLRRPFAGCPRHSTTARSRTRAGVSPAQEGMERFVPKKLMPCAQAWIRSLLDALRACRVRPRGSSHDCLPPSSPAQERAGTSHLP